MILVGLCLLVAAYTFLCGLTLMFLDAAAAFVSTGLWLSARTKVRGVLLTVGTVAFLLSKVIAVAKVAVHAE